MATTLSKSFITTNLGSRQSPVDKQADEWNGDGISNATRVSVITSTYSLPSSSEKNNDKINSIANSNSLDDKLEAKKPYGGRPLKYECPQCQRRFHAPSHLKRHVMSHSSERPFQCNVCGKGFLQAWHLGRHMTTHTGNKPFKCAECSKSFGSRFEMRTHINYIHKGIKEHKCEVCGKHFTLRSNLKVHMRKHTGEKPYQCSFCSKRFGQRGHLQYHIRKHEGKDEVLTSQNIAAAKSLRKTNQFLITKHGSVSEQSECHDDDCECDSGIGSYDSEAESSNCSSPVIHESHYDDQKSSWNGLKQDRPSSPEFALVDKARRSPLKRSYAGVQEPEIKPYVCHSCNCGFSEVNSLRAHVRHSHPRKGIVIEDYSCGFCLRHYSAVELLQFHIDEHRLLKAVADPEKSCSPSKGLCAVEPKSKMSAKSIAFSIDNICANSSSNHATKVVDLQERHPPLDSPRRESMFRPLLFPSVPVTCHSNALNGFPTSHSSDCLLKSHVSPYCQCHLDLYHLQIR